MGVAAKIRRSWDIETIFACGQSRFARRHAKAAHACECGRTISGNKRFCAACMDKHLAEIELYKQAWGARLDAGHGGPVLPEEEGRDYGPGRIVNGQMRLRDGMV